MPCHANCTEEHLSCQLLLQYKMSGGRGMHRTEHVHICNLSPKVPRVKGEALIVKGAQRGAVVYVNKLVKESGRVMGVHVRMMTPSRKSPVTESESCQWVEPIENVTNIEQLSPSS